MRKWKEDTLHFTQQAADILLLQSSNVMRKVNVHPEFIERWGVMFTVTRCKLSIALQYCMVFTFVTGSSTGKMCVVVIPIPDQPCGKWQLSVV